MVEPKRTSQLSIVKRGPGPDISALGRVMTTEEGPSLAGIAAAVGGSFTALIPLPRTANLHHTEGVAELAQRVETLEQQVRLLTRMVVERPAPPVREVDAATARGEIVRLFATREGAPLYYDTIADSLNLPLQQVVEICNELEQEGEIGEPAAAI